MARVQYQSSWLGNGQACVFVRILGASPLATKEEISTVMEQYGEIIDVKKGFVSKKCYKWNLECEVGCWSRTNYSKLCICA